MCGGGWVAHSPTQRTVHLWTLPHAPLRLLRVRFAQFVFDFDAIKALLGDDRSFALEILVSDPHPNPRATRSPRLARAFAPPAPPGAYIPGRFSQGG